MQTSFVFSQRTWPGIGSDLDECWLVATYQCQNMVTPWLRLPSAITGRKAADNPDEPGPTGGSLADTVQVCERLWPRYFKGRLKVLRGASWDALTAQVERGVPVSVSIVTGKLPPTLQYGTSVLHRVSVAKGPDGKWLWFDPLVRGQYERPKRVNPDNVKAAILAYGREKVGTSGAWAVVFPTSEAMSALYFGQTDPTPFDQDDIDDATAELRERIDDARNALDGVQ
jgi:hypothetical protein